MLNSTSWNSTLMVHFTVCKVYFVLPARNHGTRVSARGHRLAVSLFITWNGKVMKTIDVLGTYISDADDLNSDCSLTSDSLHLMMWRTFVMIWFDHLPEVNYFISFMCCLESHGPKPVGGVGGKILNSSVFRSTPESTLNKVGLRCPSARPQKLSSISMKVGV